MYSACMTSSLVPRVPNQPFQSPTSLVRLHLSLRGEVVWCGMVCPPPHGRSRWLASEKYPLPLLLSRSLTVLECCCAGMENECASLSARLGSMWACSPTVSVPCFATDPHGNSRRSIYLSRVDQPSSPNIYRGPCTYSGVLSRDSKYLSSVPNRVDPGEIRNV